MITLFTSFIFINPPYPKLSLKFITYPLIIYVYVLYIYMCVYIYL